MAFFFLNNAWTIIKNVTTLFSFTALRSISLIQCLFTHSRIILTSPRQKCWNCDAIFPLLSKTSHYHLISSPLLSLVYLVANTPLINQAGIKLGWREATFCWANVSDASRSSQAPKVMHRAALLIHNLCYTNIIHESEHPSCFTVLGCAFIFNLTVTL